MKLQWTLTWLKILSRSEKDEIFSMGIHQWIELSKFLVGLQDYSLQQTLDQPSQEKFKEQYDYCLHATLMARIYSQLLLKGKNCREQIWMKSQLLKSDKQTLEVSNSIENEIISLKHKFENVYLAHESIILERVNSVYFYQDWTSEFISTWNLTDKDVADLPKFDPWKISKIISFSDLEQERGEFKRMTKDWNSSVIIGTEQASKCLSLIKSLAIAIASECTFSLQFSAYGPKSLGIIPRVRYSPEEHHPYFTQMANLTFQTINNTLKNQGKFYNTSDIFVGYENLQSQINHLEETNHNTEKIKILRDIAQRYEDQIVLPFCLEGMFGLQNYDDALANTVFKVFASSKEKEHFKNLEAKKTEWVHDKLRNFVEQKHAYVLDYKNSSQPQLDYFS